MAESEDHSVIRFADIDKVLRSGVSSRAFTALAMTDKSHMTLDEMADVCGFKISSLKFDGRLGDLFHSQMVEPVLDVVNPRRQVLGYRITSKARRTLRRLSVIDRPFFPLLDSNPRADPKNPSPTQEGTQATQAKPKSKPEFKDIQESPTLKGQSKSKPKSRLKKPKVNPSPDPRADPRTGDCLEIKAKRGDLPPEALVKKKAKSKRSSQERRHT